MDREGGITVNRLKKENRLWIAVVMIMLLFALDCSASAEPPEGTEPTSGTCGENLMWELSAEGVLTISGSGSMQVYSSSYPWYPSKDAIKKVIICEGVTTVATSAFSGYEAITEIKFPQTLEAISDYAFSDCSGVKGLVVPNNVQSIGQGAFKGMELTSITLPFIGKTRNASGVAVPFGYIFDYREKYGTSSVPENTTFQYTDNESDFYYFIPTTLESVIITDVQIIPERAFYNCTWFTVTIQSVVHEIGTRAFYNSKGPSSLSFLGEITTIPAFAFYDCRGLQTAVLPNTVTAIEKSAFRKCSNLQVLELSNALTSIGTNAFDECTGITSLIVPNSVQSIGQGAFKGMELTSITLPFVGKSRNATDAEMPFGYIFDYKSVSGSSTGPAEATYQFTDAVGKNYYYYIPASLKTVIITDTSVIPYGAFRNCRNIQAVSICAGIESIDEYAFYNCGIQYMQIPDSVRSIAANSFNDNVVFYIHGNTYAETWAKSNSKPYNLLDVLELPASTIIIESEAFTGLPSVYAIRIPASVTNIASDAFDKGMVLLVPTGSVWAEWAETNGYTAIEELKAEPVVD